MLPDTNDGPTVSPKLRSDLLVALDIAGKLRRPVRGVGPRDNTMIRTTMKKAPIYEDCYPGPAEHQIGKYAHVAGHHRLTQPEPHTLSV